MWIRRTAVPLIINLPHVIQTVGFCAEEARFGLLTPICANGSLDAAVKGMLDGRPPDGFGPTQLSKCIFGTALTMSRFHARRGIHRNLQLSKILLDDRFEPVLGSFTNSKIVADPLSMTQEIGVPLYWAPEMHLHENYGKEVDVFSFAVLMYKLFEDAINFADGRPVSLFSLSRKVSRNERLVRPVGITDPLWQLIEACWHQEPAKRPTFAEIVDRLKSSSELVIPGTDMPEYREYVERLESEQLEDPRPDELVDALSSILGWPMSEGILCNRNN
jgi:serine/threonine protein kinase